MRELTHVSETTRGAVRYLEPEKGERREKRTTRP